MVIAVDFDNTLFETNYPEIMSPKWNVINWCKEQKLQGNILILWTCREGIELEEAISACSEVGLTFDHVNENDPRRVELFGKDCRKIGADVYVDDLSLHPQSI